MGNYLFIQGHERDKIIFFSSLSNFFQENGINCDHLAFNRRENNLYNKLNIESTFYLPKLLLKYDSTLDPNDQHLYDLDELLGYTFQLNDINHYKYSKETVYDNAKRYINFLKDYVKENEVSAFVLWNDTFMFECIAKKFAANMEIPTLIFEAGLFRPNTITFDKMGINYGNSVPRNPDYYRNLIDKEDIKNTKLDNVEKNFELKLPKLNRIDIKDRLVDYANQSIMKRELRLETIFESPFEKLRRLIKKNYLKRTIRTNENIKLPENYIFVPFQVHDDSQILLHSPYLKTMENLVEFVDKEIRIYNKKYKQNLYILFKEHPADFGRVNYSKLYKKYSDNKYFIFLKSGDTNTIIDNSKMVMTINSTVGIEALLKNKPVITLGNAFYNIQGIVENYNSEKKLHEIIYNISSKSKKQDEILLSNFLYYLKNEYQLKGNWRKGEYNSNQLIDKIKSK
ncbi:hypothetical protein [Niallia circulans]|uniref:capsular polysaccharide export protein, LipB/KpsS family n=1 Tax=Niallia circulans TaxID=1397 RepID=UPI001F1C146D|nr:hypothetical protein [Niallia circulans]MCF2649128.1 hypothetical protein [Niallia circulans]